MIIKGFSAATRFLKRTTPENPASRASASIAPAAQSIFGQSAAALKKPMYMPPTREKSTLKVSELRPGTHHGVKTHPTYGNGLQTIISVTDPALDKPIDLTTRHFIQANNAVWAGSGSYLPKKPSLAFAPSCEFSALSNITTKMAIKLADGQPGLIAKNLARKHIEQLNPRLAEKTLLLLERFSRSEDPEEIKMLSIKLNNIRHHAAWAIRAYLFEPKKHANGKHVFTSAAIPKTLSRIYDAAKASTGSIPWEFNYADYTLLTAIFPKDLDLDGLDYNNPIAIFNAVKRIKTEVGFNDVNQEEHYFRHVHSLMEQRMGLFWQGVELVFSENESERAVGWAKMCKSAWQAHQVFKTMLMGSPPEAYPNVRLPIAGTQGNCSVDGKEAVYPSHGVFYRGIGDDLFEQEDGSTCTGRIVNSEIGQTGAHSSTVKEQDLFTGTSKHRQAHRFDLEHLQRIEKLLEREISAANLHQDPIGSLQDAFDIEARPHPHLHRLVALQAKIESTGLLESNDPTTLMGRLMLSTITLDHRWIHAKYVMQYIYTQKAEGGQARGIGTGGSPASEFLGRFIGQNLMASKEVAEKLNAKSNLPLKHIPDLKKATQTLNNIENAQKAFHQMGKRILKEGDSKNTTKGT